MLVIIIMRIHFYTYILTVNTYYNYIYYFY